MTELAQQRVIARTVDGRSWTLVVGTLEEARELINDDETLWLETVDDQLVGVPHIVGLSLEWRHVLGE